MSKVYVTFGQAHTHSINGKTFDKDCVAEIECEEGEEFIKPFEIFKDGKFCMMYQEHRMDWSMMEYYPRGIIKV